MIKHISTDIRRINSGESDLGDIRLFDDNLVVAFRDLQLNKDEESTDEVFGTIQCYINFCFVVFEGVDTLTFDYDMSRNIPIEKRECYGGVNYLTNKDSEFWISYKTGKILLIEESQLRKVPYFFTKEEKEHLFHDNPITKEVLVALGVISSL